MDPTRSTVTLLARAIRERRISAYEVVEAHLARIARDNPRVNAIVTLDPERALASARAADRALASGEPVGPLHGVPFTLKDMHSTAGVRTTLGLRALADNVPSEDGIVTERLRRAGAILLGKTNMAMSIQTVSELFGRTSNPYDLERTSGGSSGGAAAAVSARLVPFDVGTDLSGSIRMPTHFCGVFGLKPTPHRIPLHGMIFGPKGTPRLDRVLAVSGPIARSAEDIALLFGVLAGPDPRDPDVPPVPLREEPRLDVRGLRFAVAPTIPGIRIATGISDALRRLAGRLADAGAHVEEKPLPFAFEDLLAAFRRLIAIPFASLDPKLAPPGTKAAATAPSVLDYLGALDERDRFIGAFDAFLGHFDSWLCPAAISTAFRHAERGAPIDVDGEPAPSGTLDHPSIVATYTGAPALVVPAALDSSGLPIGVQCIARRWGDERLVAVGGAIAGVAGELPEPPSSTD